MKYKWFILIVIIVLAFGNTNIAFADDPTPTPETGDSGDVDLSTLPKDAYILIPSDTQSNFTILPKAGPVLANGGFESGATGWTQSSSNFYPLILAGSSTPVTTHSGTWLSWLGGAPVETSVISQSNLQMVSPLFLSLWYRLGSLDTCGNDFGYVRIDATVIHTWNLCSANNTNAWVQLPLNVSAFNGQTVTLSITAQTNNANNSNLFIDDVSFFSTFADVPVGAFAEAHILSIYNAGITGGCGTNPLIYCPLGTVNRAQMAVFLMKGIHGSGYVPPAASGSVFNDVAANSFAAAYIEAFANEGITGGCGNGNYCPTGLVTRAQMAVFLLKAKHGSGYTPPAATGTMFSDVSVSSFAAAWIEQLATEGITGGCGGGNYCPNNTVTRAQMAVFLQKTFNLTLP